MGAIKRVGAFLWQWAAQASGGISVLMVIGGHFFGWNGDATFKYTAYGALVFCAILQGIKIWNLEQRLKPKLKIECGNEIDGCVKPNAPSGAKQTNMGYRLAVRALTYAEVPYCKATLTRILKNGVPIWSGDTARLTFAPSANPDSEDKKVIPGFDHFIDMIFMNYEEGAFVGIEMGTKNGIWNSQPTPNMIFKDEADYILEIAISSPEMKTIHIKVLFHFEKALGGSRIRIVSLS